MRSPFFCFAVHDFIIISFAEPLGSSHFEKFFTWVVKNMVKYVLKRVFLMIFTLLIIMTMCFVLIKLLPLPAIKVQGRDVNLILAKREQMGYNKPIMVQ